MILRKVRWMIYITVLVTMVYGGLQLELLGSTFTFSAQAQYEIEGAGACCETTDQCRHRPWSS